MTLVTKDTSTKKLGKDLIVYTPLSCMPIFEKEANFEEESCAKLVEKEVKKKEQEANQALS